MGHDWIQIFRHHQQTELRDQRHTYAKAVFIRTGVQEIYRHRLDFFGLFEKKSPIVWTPWVQELEIIEE